MQNARPYSMAFRLRSATRPRFLLCTPSSAARRRECTRFFEIDAETYSNDRGIFHTDGSFDDRKRWCGPCLHFFLIFKVEDAAVIAAKAGESGWNTLLLILARQGPTLTPLCCNTICWQRGSYCSPFRGSKEH